MKTKTRTTYNCSACDHQTPKWMGQCPECGAWNTLQEQVVSSGRGPRKSTAAASPVKSLGDIDEHDFPRLLQRYSEIRAILFNGATSEKYFKQLVVPQLVEHHDIELLRMPSTSPAHAGMSFDQKLDAWRQLLEFIDQEASG